MELRYENGLYYAVSAYDDLIGTELARAVLKRQGFRWNPDARQWQTTDAYIARTVRKYADVACAIHLEKLIAEQERTKVLSRAETIPIDPPCPTGQAYYPFQKVGVVFAAERPAVIIGDEMGLGKTPETLGMLNITPHVRTVLTVCPNSVKLNWQQEARAWLLPDLGYVTTVVTAKWTATDLRHFYEHLGPQHRGLAIVNYEIMHRFCTVLDFPTAGPKKVQTLQFLGGFPIDQIVLDEAHRIKGNTRQTRAVLGVLAGRKLALSGSPIPNRPVELWNLLHYLDPLRWNDKTFFAFVMRYCNAHQNDFGKWDFSGSSHEAELQDLLRSQYLIRRLKKDVIPELPPKRRQLIELSIDDAGKGAATLVKAEWQAYQRLQAGAAGLLALQAAVQLAKAADDEQDYRLAIANLKDGQQAAFSEMAKMREATALAKLPQVIEHIEECLETEDKLVVYFWHHSVAHRLIDHFKAYDPAVIMGKTTLNQRQAAKERFQTDPTCKLFLGSIPAAGEGITLTAASLMLLVEMSWVPKDLKQVEDRLHRITQEKPVLIRYLVFERSLDATMLRTVVQKNSVIDAVLDVEHHFTVEELEYLPCAPAVTVEEPEQAPATASVSREHVVQEALQIDPAEVLRVHRALQYLAGVCDFAHAKDGQGFNLIDARIGHSLATQATLTPRQAVLGQKILLKYHKQLEGAHL